MSDQDQAMLTVSLSDAIAQWLKDVEGTYPDFTADRMANAAIAVLTAIHDTQVEAAKETEYWENKTA